MRLINEVDCFMCHEDMLERNHETFHGKVMAPGSTDVAAFIDCRGYHSITRTESPDSPIHPDSRVAASAKCHSGANANFA